MNVNGRALTAVVFPNDCKSRGKTFSSCNEPHLFSRLIPKEIVPSGNARIVTGGRSISLYAYDQLYAGLIPMRNTQLEALAVGSIRPEILFFT